MQYTGILMAMSDRLLREYLTLVIEKIRSKQGSSGKSTERFDLKRFKKLDDNREMLKYANDHLDQLGVGSSRVAFLLSGRYALKVALNEKGYGQNEAELDVYTNPKTKRVIAKVYAAHDENAWLISDLVKPIKSEKEFEQLAKVSWEDFSKQVWEGIVLHDVDGASDFAKAVVATANSNNLLFGDLADQLGQKNAHFKSVIDHWGKTPDGRVVLLDYGFTEAVNQKHYAPERELRHKGTGGAPQKRGPDAVVSPKKGEDVDSYAQTKQKSGGRMLPPPEPQSAGPMPAGMRPPPKAASRSGEKTPGEVPAHKRRRQPTDAELAKTRRA